MKKESVLRFTKAGLFLILFYAGIFFRSTPFITIAASLLFLTLFERYLNIKIPTSFSIVFVVFVVLSLVLWSYADFYEKFSWWDDMLHFSYWIWFSIIWYLIIYYLYYKKWIENDIFITVAFSFCFTVAFWAIWEIYEYSIDSFFWMNMQRTEIWRGVDDTMQDIILETLASLLTNIYIYAYLKAKSNNWIWVLTKEFLNENKTDEYKK